MRLIERVWYGDSQMDRLARGALAPFEAIYRGVVAVRGELYDRKIMPSRHSGIPVVSVGNITVGGTGKTPVAAWLASRLAQAGWNPAIILRGYGGDEPLVHARLNPGIPVVVASDRVAGVAIAARAGSDVVVLDDAFQHRQAARDADVVLVSADDWPHHLRALPAGPYREPASALKRASTIVITRKAASDAAVARVEEMVSEIAPGIPVAIARLDLHEVIREGNQAERIPAAALAGRRVLAIAAVGNPGAFFGQLEAIGARVTRRAFPDHHAFTRADIDTALEAGLLYDYVVCTLKDAVKLGPRWPAGNSPLWYVSLAVQIERGEPAIDSLLMRLRGRIDAG